MEENQKISFFKRMIYSIKDFEKYQIFAFEKLSSAIRYFLKFVLIYTILVAISVVPVILKEINSGINYFKSDIPDFEYKDNKLSINKQDATIIENKENSIILIMDTNTNEQTKIDEYTKKIGGFSNGILLLNDRIIYKNGTSINTNMITYEQLKTKFEIPDFTKQSILKKIEELGNFRLGLYITSITCIQIYMKYLIESLLIALEIGLFAFILARISGLKLKLSSCYNISIYSLTLSTIINAIAIACRIWLNFEIKYIDMMYMLISYIYVITAILMIKSDLIKKHIELMTIQAQIKKELDERQREKEEKQEEEEKKENQDNKDEKKEEKKDKGENLGGEAKGEA